jgi:hypothetical protein
VRSHLINRHGSFLIPHVRNIQKLVLARQIPCKLDVLIAHHEEVDWPNFRKIVGLKYSHERVVGTMIHKRVRRSVNDSQPVRRRERERRIQRECMRLRGREACPEPVAPCPESSTSQSQDRQEQDGRAHIQTSSDSFSSANTTRCADFRRRLAKTLDPEHHQNISICCGRLLQKQGLIGFKGKTCAAPTAHPVSSHGPAHRSMEDFGPSNTGKLLQVRPSTLMHCPGPLRHTAPLRGVGPSIQAHQRSPAAASQAWSYRKGTRSL